MIYNKKMLKKYIKLILSESSEKKDINKALKETLIYLGFKESDLDLFEKIIDSVLSRANIIHHQFGGITGDPITQFKTPLKLNNVGSQTHLWSMNSKQGIINMCYAVLANSINVDLQKEVEENVLQKYGYSEIINLFYGRVHKDPLGIQLFVVPKEMSHKKFIDWFEDNCLIPDDWKPFQDLKFCSLKTLKIDDKNKKSMSSYTAVKKSIPTKALAKLK